MQRLLVLFLVFVGGTVLAQDYDADQLAEIERRKQFRAAFESIVADLDSLDPGSFTRSIDSDQMRDRILGLRLIDRRVQKSFSENFEDNLPDIVIGEFDWSGETQGVELLSFRSSGADGLALIRVDQPNFQFNYLELTLRWDDDRQRLYIIDWLDFLYGQSFTDTYGESLIAAAPSRPAVRKLVSKRINDSQVFQLTELLKAARDRQAERFTEIFNSMNEQLKSERIVVMTHAKFMRQERRRRRLRTALIEVDKYYPEDPMFALMLLDYYFPTRQFDKALDTLLRLETRLGVEDSAMKARLSAASLVAGKPADALAYSEQAVEMQPDLELAWWSLLRANLVDGNHARSIEALTKLEDEFEHTLNREALARDRMFARLLATPEYQEWSSARHTEGDD